MNMVAAIASHLHATHAVSTNVLYVGVRPPFPNAHYVDESFWLGEITIIMKKESQPERNAVLMSFFFFLSEYLNEVAWFILCNY